MRFFHVDVFSAKPLGGNGLAVVFPDRALDAGVLREITREFKQFETSFIYPAKGGAFPVRIFTVDEELPFAGHPLLGSGAMIHHRFFADAEKARITVTLGGRSVLLESARRLSGRAGGDYSVTMNQGKPSFLGAVSAGHAGEIAASLNLEAACLDPAFPVEVVSTGLPYLLVPLRSGLERARIARNGFEPFLSRFGAKFAYLFDTATLECRTWDNAGRVEDSATGSAAGPLGGYLVKNGFRKAGEPILISQGRFCGRPAVLECRSENGEMLVRGDVSIFSQGDISL